MDILRIRTLLRETFPFREDPRLIPAEQDQKEAEQLRRVLKSIFEQELGQSPADGIPREPAMRD